MTDISASGGTAANPARLSPVLTAANPARLSPVLTTAALVALCSAYIQGPIVKISDFPSAIAEMAHFGLQPAPAFAVGVIVFELAMSALVISGLYRWVAALSLAVFTLIATLIALRFWELPVGMDRSMAMNAFFEHLGLVGAFVLVAGHDLVRRAPARVSA